MFYRRLGNCEKDLSILGFGAMRLPLIDGKADQIDEPLATRMLRRAIDGGVNYIDTAYPYHTCDMAQPGASEPFVGRALRGVDRSKVFLATKLPSWAVTCRADMDKYLNHQLERLETDHIDFYLLHALTRPMWENLKRHDVAEFLDKAIADGRIGCAGFSFHDQLDVFKEIVDFYPFTFCQIQYNFMEEDYQAGRAGIDYAAARGLGVVAMEPLHGGALAGPVPADVQAVWDAAGIERSPAEWAFRFLYSHPAIGVVLSGMSRMEHVDDNLSIARRAGQPVPLLTEEQAAYARVKEIYQSRIQVNCTGCRYCMPCPHGVDIPTCFEQWNKAAVFGNVAATRIHYNFLVGGPKAASNCVECGECEPNCPQHIPIPQKLKEVAATFAT